MPRHNNAFTLVELMIVVALIGIIAAFGIPNYSKSQQRVDEKAAENNLKVIASTMEMYKLRDGNLPPEYPLGSDMDDVDEINATLSLGVILQNMAYDCTGDGTIFTCTAVSTYGWELDVSETDGGDPRCSSGACPTCTGGGC